MTSAQYINLVVLVAFTLPEVLEVRVINDGGAFKIQAVAIDDAAGENVAEAAISSGTKQVEIRLVGATGSTSNDGEVHIYVDESLIDSNTGFDNYDRFQDLVGGSVKVTAGQNNSDSSSGSLYVDNFVIRDDDTAIFDTTFTGYDLVLGGGQP